ncbi:hypothetical protein M513_11509, partial [Trichuris suis]
MSSMGNPRLLQASVHYVLLAMYLMFPLGGALLLMLTNGNVPDGKEGLRKRAGTRYDKTNKEIPRQLSMTTKNPERYHLLCIIGCELVTVCQLVSTILCDGMVPEAEMQPS